jgi:hypothetical protein
LSSIFELLDPVLLCRAKGFVMSKFGPLVAARVVADIGRKCFYRLVAPCSGVTLTVCYVALCCVVKASAAEGAVIAAPAISAVIAISQEEHRAPFLGYRLGRQAMDSPRCSGKLEQMWRKTGLFVEW